MGLISVFKLFENNGSLGAAKATPATNTKAIRRKRRKSFIVDILESNGSLDKVALVEIQCIRAGQMIVRSFAIPVK